MRETECLKALRGSPDIPRFQQLAGFPLRLKGQLDAQRVGQENEQHGEK